MIRIQTDTDKKRQKGSIKFPWPLYFVSISIFKWLIDSKCFQIPLQILVKIGNSIQNQILRVLRRFNDISIRDKTSRRKCNKSDRCINANHEINRMNICSLFMISKVLDSFCKPSCNIVNTGDNVLNFAVNGTFSYDTFKSLFEILIKTICGWSSYVFTLPLLNFEMKTILFIINSIGIEIHLVLQINIYFGTNKFNKLLFINIFIIV